MQYFQFVPRRSHRARAYRTEPVLVYYSYQPNSDSRLEDFAAASTHAYRFGKTALAIGFTFLRPVRRSASALWHARTNAKTILDPDLDKNVKKHIGSSR